MVKLESIWRAYTFILIIHLHLTLWSCFLERLQRINARQASHYGTNDIEFIFLSGYFLYFVLNVVAACKGWICWSYSCGFVIMGREIFHLFLNVHNESLKKNKNKYLPQRCNWWQLFPEFCLLPHFSFFCHFGKFLLLPCPINTYSYLYVIMQ